MFTKTIEVEGFKATFHTETGLDVIKRRMVLATCITFGPRNIEDDIINEFAHILTRSEDVTAPFNWPAPTDSKEVIMEACHAFFALPSTVYTSCVKALNEVNKPPGDIDLSPAADEKKSGNAA